MVNDEKKETPTKLSRKLIDYGWLAISVIVILGLLLVFAKLVWSYLIR